MKIIKPSTEIMFPNSREDIEDMYKRIESAGRTCYKSEEKITEDSAKKFITGLIKRGHEAMIEHASMTVKFIVDRGVSHEIVRHRIASYAQESTRYCVAGDTKLTFKNPHQKMTIEELYQKKQNSPNGAWKRLNVRQYNNDTGELQFSKIKDIFYNGVKPCMKIKTKLGYEITCTSDHQILTPTGYKETNELSVGEKIYVNGTEALYMNYDWMFNQNITLNKTFVQIAKEFGFNASTLKKWAHKLGIPKKGTGYFNVGHTPWNKGITDKRQTKALREYHHCGRRKDKILKEDTSKYHKHIKNECEICGTTENLEVHHIDKNHSNNNTSNLMTLCESCHGRTHTQNLSVAYADEIISVEDVDNMNVYDIEMDSEYHNFVANGIVVHNCNYSQDKFGNELTFIEPCFWSDEYPSNSWHLMNQWKLNMKHAEDAYLEMLRMGAKPEEARSVLPNSLKTEIVVTMNLREWKHFFKLRAVGTTGKPHPQMVEVALPLLKQCQELMPEIFGDIV